MSEFNVGLLDCCAGGAGKCLYGWCCTPCAFASARSAYDSSNFLFNLCCATGPVVHSIIREGYGIEGNCCQDILLASCCGPCSAVRLNAEVAQRGPGSKSMSK